MSATMAMPGPATRTPTRTPTRTVLVRTAAAEWSRMWSVRSSWTFTLVTALVVVGFGAIIGAQTNPSSVDAGSTAWDGARLTSMLALFGILTLSVLTTTADHVTGGIVPTLQWTPRRPVLLAARACVVVATTTVLGVVLVAGAGLAVWLFLPQLGLPVGDGGRTLAEMGFVFASGSVLAVGLGLLTRSTAGGLVSVIGLVLVLPFLMAQLPYDWAVTTAAHLPGSGALFLIFGEGPSDDMTEASSRITLVVWAVAALIAGGGRLLRADANR